MSHEHEKEHPEILLYQRVVQGDQKHVRIFVFLWDIKLGNVVTFHH